MLLSCQTQALICQEIVFLKVFGTRALKCSVEMAYCPVDNENWGDAFPLGPPFDSSAFSLVSAGDAFSQTFTSHLIPPCLFPLSSPGVPSPLSVRPVWRQYVKPSWQPTAPLSASNPQLPAPLVPSLACWSSLPVGWASAAVTPSSEPLDGTLDPPAYIS